MTRKKSKYKPRAIIHDTLEFVTTGMRPVTSYARQMTKMRIQNSQAMYALVRGGATKEDMSMLIAMSNMVDVLCKAGFGKQYASCQKDGEQALESIAKRFITTHTFTPTGPEIKALNTLLELHEAQMEVITVADFNKATVLTQKQIDETRKLPFIGELTK